MWRLTADLPRKNDRACTTALVSPDLPALLLVFSVRDELQQLSVRIRLQGGREMSSSEPVTISLVVSSPF
jgi:hypothetical protein